MPIHIPIHRSVLFEKYNIKHEINDFLLSQLEGCETLEVEDYPDSIFYVKENVWLFWQDNAKSKFWINDLLWRQLNGRFHIAIIDLDELLINAFQHPLQALGLNPGLHNKFVWPSVGNPLG